MKLCRFALPHDPVAIPGITLDGATVHDLSAAGVGELTEVFERPDAAAWLQALPLADLPAFPVSEVQLLAPVDNQPVWAAGVTYMRSKAARMEESEFSASAYDRVYEAPRPEIFFKALAENVVPSGAPVGIRHDATWSVPEPEMVLVFNSRGEAVGCGIGNDMSSRDIEGENLLYLPQAKTYDRSCAIGPWISVGLNEIEVRTWDIDLIIVRGGIQVFAGTTSVGQIKRTFAELGSWLFRCQKFSSGVMLLTGTGIVPPDSFTLREGDQLSISIGPIGTLRNHVIVV